MGWGNGVKNLKRFSWWTRGVMGVGRKESVASALHGMGPNWHNTRKRNGKIFIWKGVAEWGWREWNFHWFRVIQLELELASDVGPLIWAPPVGSTWLWCLFWYDSLPCERSICVFLRILGLYEWVGDNDV